MRCGPEMDANQSPWTPGRTLSAWERALVRSVAEAMFHEPTNPIPPDRLEWLADDVDDYMSRISGFSRFGLRFALRVLSASPILLGQALSLLQSLPIPKRIVCLQHLENSSLAPVAMVFFLVKVVMSATYFEHPDALVLTGFDNLALFGPRTDNPLQRLIHNTQ